MQEVSHRDCLPFHRLGRGKGKLVIGDLLWSFRNDLSGAGGLKDPVLETFQSAE